MAKVSVLLPVARAIPLKAFRWRHSRKLHSAAQPGEVTNFQTKRTLNLMDL